MGKEIRKGDIVYVVRTLTQSEKREAALVGLGGMITYRHYGVAVGDHTVIHFVGSSGIFSGDIRIRHTSMAEFAKGSSVEVDDYAMNGGSFHPNDSVSRAFSKLGSNFGGYHLINNNCEHFATWAVTGKKLSRQANIVKGNPDQDLVENAIDRASAVVDKVFDPLIEMGDKIDRVMGWGDHKYSSDTIGDRISRFFKSW